MNVSEHVISTLEGIYALARRKLAQPLVDLVHRWNGPAYHQISIWGYIAAASGLAGMTATEIARRSLWIPRGPVLAIAFWAISTSTMGLVLCESIRHQKIFSRKAKADPFIAFDARYRTRPYGPVIAALTISSGLDLPVQIFGLFQTISMIERSGAPWTHPFVMTLLASSVFSIVFAGGWLVGLLAGGCERPRCGRRQKKEEAERAPNSTSEATP